MIFFQQRARHLRCQWRLVFLLAVFFGAAFSRGATNGAAARYEPSPPKTGSIKWEENQRRLKERQEMYRQRVPIPGATGENVPRLEAASVFSRKVATTEATASTEPGSFQKILFALVVFFLGGFLLVRKFAPHLLAEWNESLNPWAKTPAFNRTTHEPVRAEDKSFAEFLATARVGSPASATAALPAREILAKEFSKSSAKLLDRQRQLLQAIIREPRGLARQALLAKLHDEMDRLKDAADFPQALLVWQLASALKGLLKQLTDKMGNVTPSSLRTVGGGLELLVELCATGLRPDLLAEQPLKFLVVDDDLVSRHALSFALSKAFSQPDLAVDGSSALVKVDEQAYDVIFLDVQMPGMDGFEVCLKIRETVLNRRAPVVFVSVQNDFAARANSTLSGGNDLFGKPFLTFEITVKALTLALQGRLHGRAIERERAGDLMEPLLKTFAPEPALAAAIITLPPSRRPLATEEFTRAFLARAMKHLDPLRDICRQLPSATDEVARQALLVDGFLRINSLVAPDGAGLVHPAYQMCVALEGLFKKLLESAKNSSASTLGTIATAMEILPELCGPEMKTNFASAPPIELLVVDDDLVARRVIVGALQTAFRRPENVESGADALTLAAEKPFDVIFLDVVMPEMDGFETCLKIRSTIPNATTPIIFVTAKTDFDARAELARTGGNDLLAKPFLTAEITLKALTFSLRGRLRRFRP